MPLPLKEPEFHTTSPVMAMLLPVVNVAALPVVDWLSVGKPVAFVKTNAEGVPNAGVVSVGFVSVLLVNV